MSLEGEVGDWLAHQSDQVIETSCARIYLAGDFALKMKKPVSLGFLDFSTLDRRRWALKRELAFNRRWGGDIYRRLRAVTWKDNSLALDGSGEVVEWLLEMRRFDPQATLGHQPRKVTPDLAESLGRMIARLHMAAPVTPRGGGAAAMAYTLESNARRLRAQAGKLGAAEVSALNADSQAALNALAPLLDARRASGFARECHGDLHLGNILLEDGAPQLFDCIEFNDRLSRIDIQYDIAFTLMDLHFRDRHEGANRLMNAWLDEAARGCPDGLWSGLEALSLMLATRAAVRTHVCASTGEIEVAHRYLTAARRHLRPTKPRLFAIGGLSGTGKTTLARELAPRIPGAPGAVILRSDEIRKRLLGRSALSSLPPSAYAADADETVAREMFGIAQTVLAAGRCVILDATFLHPGWRDRAKALALRSGSRLEAVWLEGDKDLLLARLAARRDDASDADSRVLERQLRDARPPADWPRAPAGSDFAKVAVALARPRGG